MRLKINVITNRSKSNDKIAMMLLSQDALNSCASPNGTRDVLELRLEFVNN